MSFSSLSDKRDLLLVFGLDRKIQIKDSFFHNANSIVRKDVLKDIPFDSKATNIEDRLWGQEVIKQGLKILYEPEASVFHYHGIHQDGNSERLKNVVRIIENESYDFKVGKIKPDDLNIVAIIPIKGKSPLLGKKSRLNYTLDCALNSKYISNIFITTDHEKNRKEAKKMVGVSTTPIGRFLPLPPDSVFFMTATSSVVMRRWRWLRPRRDELRLRVRKIRACHGSQRFWGRGDLRQSIP